MVKADRVVRYEALDPHGLMPDVQLISLAPRLSDLNDKVIYIINSWPIGSGSQLDDLLIKIGDLLTKRFPSAKIKSKAKPSAYRTDDAEFWDQIVKKADAFL